MTVSQANSVSVDHIDALLSSLTFEYERIGNTNTTVCYAFLPNGFRVGHGDSACVDPANYKYEDGCKWARERALIDAKKNLWMMEGYLLKVTGNTSERYQPSKMESCSAAADTAPRACEELEGFKVYQGKAINRIAYEIQLDDVITPIKRANELDTGGPALSEIVIGDVEYQFAHFEPVLAGDFICFLDDTDIYHVRQSIMQQRNYL